MQKSDYVIHGRAADRERLRVLSRVLREQTLELLRDAGLTAGLSCLDVGCGGGDASFEMARLVGPAGRVVGIDLDAGTLALADAEAAHNRLTNVGFRQGDIRRGDMPDERFDVVFARQLLCHLPDEAFALAAMMKCARPGGLVIVEDVDLRGHFCYPEFTEFDEMIAVGRRAIRSGGGDPDFAPKLPGLMARAGLEGVAYRVRQPVSTSPDIKAVHLMSLEHVTEVAVAEGIATHADIERFQRALRERANDPTSLMSLPRYIQAWGRKPVSAD